jgi:hypothetical protein
MHHCKSKRLTIQSKLLGSVQLLGRIGPLRESMCASNYPPVRLWAKPRTNRGRHDPILRRFVHSLWTGFQNGRDFDTAS